MMESHEMPRDPRQKTIQKSIAILLTVTYIIILSFFDTLPLDAIKKNVVVTNQKYNSLTIASSSPVPPGKYSNIPFEKAQALTTFELKKPQYIPGNLTNLPSIDVFIEQYPLAKAVFSFQKDDNSLIIKQRNYLSENPNNQYLSSGTKIEKINVDDKHQFLLIRNNNEINLYWSDHLINYHLIAKNIQLPEVMKIVKSFD